MGTSTTTTTTLIFPWPLVVPTEVTIKLPEKSHARLLTNCVWVDQFAKLLDEIWKNDLVNFNTVRVAFPKKQISSAIAYECVRVYTSNKEATVCPRYHCLYFQILHAIYSQLSSLISRQSRERPNPDWSFKNGLLSELKIVFICV